MANPAFQNSSPCSHNILRTEFYFHLYLHHIHDGPNRNQRTAFDRAVVTDWVIYDNLPDVSNAKLVARAQGLHVEANSKQKNWHASFTILFEDERFKGSTLEVMGTGTNGQEWAIVGGTGEFTLAQGVIYHKGRNIKSGEQVLELDGHAFYTPIKRKKDSGASDGHNTWTLGPA